jgi:hypothetical protein
MAPDRAGKHRGGDRGDVEWEAGDQQRGVDGRGGTALCVFGSTRILVPSMSKKAKQNREEPIDNEWVVEAEFYARRCGLTRDEALKLLKEASPSKTGSQATGKARVSITKRYPLN